MATKILQVELEHALPERVEGAERYDRVWVVPMRAGVPVGRIVIENGRRPVLREQLRSEVLHQLAAQTGTDDAGTENGVAAFGAPPETETLADSCAPESERRLQTSRRAPFSLSLVVCTRDRPVELRQCLQSLTTLSTGPH